jgi:NAD(P)-dependent dehydrogenase (short-subunit alcohol dehydrogenase family)
MPELTGQVALITGAAGGIGSVMASKFVAEGSSVVLVDTSPLKRWGDFQLTAYFIKVVQRASSHTGGRSREHPWKKLCQ